MTPELQKIKKLYRKITKTKGGRKIFKPSKSLGGHFYCVGSNKKFVLWTDGSAVFWYHHPVLLKKRVLVPFQEVFEKSTGEVRNFFINNLDLLT